MMNDTDQKIIDLYLKTRQQQPSEHVDNRILLAAKNKLSNNKNKPKKLIWSLSSVAVIVLSVNVALKLIVEPTMTQAPYAPSIIQEELNAEMEEASGNKTTESDITAIKENKTEHRQLAKKKAILKYQADKNQKKMARAKQKPMSEASLRMEALSLSDSIIASETLPFFPFDIKNLKALYPSLTIKKINTHTIQISGTESLILSITFIKAGLAEVTAYPQHNELALRIDWTLRPNCNLNQTKQQCLISQKQTGHFENNRLIKVTWKQ